MNQSKVYQVIDGELVGIELSPLAQRMFFHGKKCTSDGFTDYRNDEQKKMHQLAISVGACELANTVLFSNRVVSPEYFREELVNFLMKSVELATDVFLLHDGNGTTALRTVDEV